ncbi:hypothetical protein [Clostridium sp.]|uniref:hypothetical protein n=1 Tax=Clostridium sp. TaxID=1506 RepID=UPI001A588016|nr:hypothetical protein [Clostridium sp.]MBK5235609.1 hypothetical protein [Clostridium sp.]
MATDNKRVGYSFSIKKTDNPIIKEFIQAQDNFSESLRYLIIKYCAENGIENVSSKLNELIYNLAFSNKNKNTSKEIKNSNKEEKIIEKSTVNNSSKDINENVITSSEDEISADLDKEDIPKCYQ